ncbi:unnamed protein product, partial [Tuber aestivum]
TTTTTTTSSHQCHHPSHSSFLSRPARPGVSQLVRFSDWANASAPSWKICGGWRLAGSIGEDIADAGNREFKGNARGEEEVGRKEGVEYLPPPPFIFKLFFSPK